MKKTKLLVIFTTIILIAVSVSWAISSSRLTEREKRAKVDFRIDNMAYWVRMAEAGYIPFNPDVKAPPAVFTGSKIHSPMVVTEDSPDVPVTTENSTQSENSIFVDINDANTVLNSNNSTPNPASGVYGANYLYSFDAAESFEGSIFGAGGSNSGDPTTAIGTDGRWYVNFISSAGGQGISYSDNQGQNWTMKTVAPNPGSLADKNHMWIDRKAGSPYENNLYVAWTPFGGSNDGKIVVSRSTDKGETWSSQINISQALGYFHQGVNLQTGPNGEVYAVWGLGGGGDESGIGFNKSTDGGATWGTAKAIITGIRGIRSSGVPQNMRVNSFPVMTCDIGDGSTSGNLYVTWTNIGVPGQNTGQARSVYMIKSTDGGETWSTPIRINTDPIEDGNANYFGWIAADPSNGMLACVFYSNRNTTSNQAEAWCALSGNAGESWEDFKVSDVSFTPAPIPGLAGQYFGDYLACAAYDGWVYPCWTDNRSGHALTYVSAFQTINVVPPYNLQAIVNQDNGQATLDWAYTEGNGFQYFKIYRNDELIGTTTEITYSDQLTEYGYYTYKVTAYYGGENESSPTSKNTQYGSSAISVIPSSMVANVYINSTLDQIMKIKNTGVLDLTFSLSPFMGMNSIKTYPAAIGGGDEYIKSVKINEYSNTTASDKYSDYTSDYILLRSTETYTLTVEAGVAYEGDQCVAWIDYNQNGVFDEDMIMLNADESGKLFSASIAPAKGSKQGLTRMRIRLAGPNDKLSPASESTYGEVEDYSIIIADWLSINPDEGVVAPGDSLEITVTFDATDLVTGTYTDDIKFKTNDINMIYYPVDFTMNVTDLQITVSAESSGICDGETTVVMANPVGGTGTYTYSWTSIPEGFTSTEQNPVVQPGVETIYIATVNDGVVAMSDSVTVAVYSNPVVSLGDDQVLCTETEFILDAGNPGSSYLWSTGATTQDIVATGNGETLFWVTVTNENNCSDSDTVYINFSSVPVVSLGNDTIVCQTGSFTLNAGNPGATYEWSTGQTTQTITFNASTYPVGTQTVTVEVTNGAGCSNTAQKKIEIRDCTGLNELSGKISLDVFPNPTSGLFNLKMESLSDLEVSVRIISSDGNEVYRSEKFIVDGKYSRQINLSQVSEGIYTIFVSGDDFAVSRKMVVRK